MIMRAEEHSCTQFNNQWVSKWLMKTKKCISGSVLARNAIPVLHSCAAMLKIAEMEYSGANSIFIRLEISEIAVFLVLCWTYQTKTSRYNEICGNLIPRHFSASTKSSLALHSIPPIVASSNVGYRTFVLTSLFMIYYYQYMCVWEHLSCSGLSWTRSMLCLIGWSTLWFFTSLALEAKNDSFLSSGTR